MSGNCQGILIRLKCDNPVHRVRFRFQSKLPTTEMGLEFESVPKSVSCNVNEPIYSESENVASFRTRRLLH